MNLLRTIACFFGLHSYIILPFFRAEETAEYKRLWVSESCGICKKERRVGLAHEHIKVKGAENGAD